MFLYIDRNPKLYYVIIPLIVASCLTLREPFNDIPRMSLHFLSVFICFGMLISRYRKEFLALSDKYTWLLVLITAALLGVDIYLYPEYNNALKLAA